MPYAKYHRKEKENERSKKRYKEGKLKKYPHKYIKKGYNPKSKLNIHPPELFKEKNPNWKGGITPTCRKIRTSMEYKQWRSNVFKRDNWTCQTCNKKGFVLNVHHIKCFAKIFKENNIKTFEESLKCKELWDINNGVTLCKECHDLVKKGGRN